METATEKITRLLLTYPKRSWTQKELADRVDCSKAFLSKLAKKFAAKGIISHGKEIILLSPTRLLNIWCSLRELPTPVYIKTDKGKEKVLRELKKREDYCLTLFSAAWFRIKFMRTDRIEAYITRKEANSFIKKFGEKSKNPTNFIIFPAEESIFEGSELVDDVRLVSVIQNYVDLMSYGGTGTRVAMRLAEKYKLLG